MRIHTNLTENEVKSAISAAGAYSTKFSVHGSRKAKFGYDVILGGNSNHRQNQGNDYAATWDQWGVFLGAIFNADPDATCWAYKSGEDFNFQTNNRFADGWPNDSHGDHKWVVGAPFVQHCNKCTALRRWAPKDV
jgi:hypothetical protein